jgi:hypothetical protein
MTIAPTLLNVPYAPPKITWQRWHSMDDKFPMYPWDKTMPQAELTLNLMQGSRINPKLSAWEQLHGRYDFNATPIAPPGIKVLAHLKANQRESWSPHAFVA